MCSGYKYSEQASLGFRSLNCNDPGYQIKTIKGSYYWCLFCLKLPKTFITCLLQCPKTTRRIICYHDKKHIFWGEPKQKKTKPTTNTAQKLVFPFSPSVNSIPKTVRETSRHWKYSVPLPVLLLAICIISGELFKPFVSQYICLEKEFLPTVVHSFLWSCLNTSEKTYGGINNWNYSISFPWCPAFAALPCICSPQHLQSQLSPWCASSYPKRTLLLQPPIAKTSLENHQWDDHLRK